MRYAAIALLALFYGCSEKPKKESIQEFEFVISEKPFKDWHTGKFYYKEPKIGTFLINRSDSIQEEFIKSTGMIVEFDIDWTTDSTYTLTFVKIAENPNNKSIAEGAERMVKQCTITQLYELSYVEKSTSNLSDKIIFTKIYRK
ncbi:MAG: hypothetical protein ACI80H_000508 [Pseudoalteromonas distincta]